MNKYNTGGGGAKNCFGVCLSTWVCPEQVSLQSLNGLKKKASPYLVFLDQRLGTGLIMSDILT